MGQKILDKEQIYNIMNGYAAMEIPASVENVQIENEFANGKACEKLYQQVYEVKCHLNERLGTQEDSEVELLIDNMTEIAKILSLKMYEYGALLHK